jgi:formate/nitrite transporter FocA (FNT family)
MEQRKPRKKDYSDILQEEIESGTSESVRPPRGLLLSGVSAGLDLGFGVLMMGIALTIVEQDPVHPLVQRLLLAAAYAVGFLFVNLGRSELFTEHTTLMVFPVLHRTRTVGALLRSWALVYTGNLIGGAVLAVATGLFGVRFGVIRPEALGEIASHMVDHSAGVILVSAVLAGWMMGLLSWLASATSDTISRIVCVCLVTGAIGFAQLHHCIAGSVEVIAGFFGSPAVSPADYLHFQMWATLGNIIGGGVFACLKYAHSTHGPQGD